MLCQIPCHSFKRPPSHSIAPPSKPYSHPHKQRGQLPSSPSATADDGPERERADVVLLLPRERTQRTPDPQERHKPARRAHDSAFEAEDFGDAYTWWRPFGTDDGLAGIRRRRYLSRGLGPSNDRSDESNTINSVTSSSIEYSSYDSSSDVPQSSITSSQLSKTSIGTSARPSVVSRPRRKTLSDHPPTVSQKRKRSSSQSHRHGARVFPPPCEMDEILGYPVFYDGLQPFYDNEDLLPTDPFASFSQLAALDPTYDPFNELSGHEYVVPPVISPNGGELVLSGRSVQATPSRKGFRDRIRALAADRTKLTIGRNSRSGAW